MDADELAVLHRVHTAATWAAWRDVYALVAYRPDAPDAIRNVIEKHKLAAAAAFRKHVDEQGSRGLATFRAYIKEHGNG